MPRRFGFGLGFNISRLSGLPEPSGFVAKYQAYDVDDFTLVTGSNVSQWDDRTTQTFGSEEVVNGTFDNDLSGWAAGAWFWENGKAKLIGDGSPQSISQSNVFEIGKTYLVEFDVESSGGNVGVQDASNTVITALSGNTGRIFATLTADRTDMSFKRVSGTVTATLDNISVKEVLTGANNLTQGTSTNQPILTQDANRFDNTVDFGTNDFMGGLPPQTGDFTYVIKGLDIPNYTSEGNRIIGEAGQSTSRVININGELRVVDDSSTVVFNESWNNESTIAVTLSGTTLKVYADSMQLGVDTDVTGSTFSNINSVGNSVASLNGSLQELYVYNRALTQDEINWFSYLRDSNNNISPLPPILPS